MKDRRSLKGHLVEILALDRQHLRKRADFINDHEVQATLSFDLPTSVSKTEAWYSRVALDSSRVDLTMKSTQTGDIIGFCGFINVDRKSQKAEHYIFIGDKEYWGRGCGSSAYKILTNFGFTELGLNKIWGYQLEGNTAASRVTDRLGYRVEGFLLSDILSHGELKDRRIIAILKDDWKKIALFDEY